MAVYQDTALLLKLIVCCCLGIPVSSDCILHTSFVSIATWLNAKEASTANSMTDGPASMDVDPPAGENTASSSGAVANSPDQVAAQEQIIEKVMQEFIFHSRAEVWVVNTQYYFACLLPPLHPAIQTSADTDMHRPAAISVKLTFQRSVLQSSNLRLLMWKRSVWQETVPECCEPA